MPSASPLATASPRRAAAWFNQPLLPTSELRSAAADLKRSANKMIATLRTAFRTWTPWEEALTNAVLSKLGPKSQSIIRAQLASVNKVQRILGWREIDLYVKKKGKVDRSGVPTLFDDREFVLAKAATTVGTERFFTTVSCIGGYLFSFESDAEVRRFAFRDDHVIEVLEFDTRFA